MSQVIAIRLQPSMKHMPGADCRETFTVRTYANLKPGDLVRMVDGDSHVPDPPRSPIARVVSLKPRTAMINDIEVEYLAT